MGLFDWLKGAGAGAGETIKGTLEGAGGFARDVRTAITGDIDPERLADLQSQAAKLENDARLAQMQINEAEAKSTNWFVAGWRPAIGWTGALALFYHFVFRPIANGFWPDLFAEIDAAALWPIIAGMLGLGTMRTAEKQTGTQDKH